MSARIGGLMTELELALADVIETLPTPGGFEWCAVSSEQYDRACRGAGVPLDDIRGLPTVYVEFFDGEKLTQHYLVGQHDLAPAVRP